MSARHRFTGAAILVLVTQPTVALSEVSITAARTEGVATATADNGTPADVSISSAGSITLSSGAGLVVNSDNTASNAGAITSTDVNNATGVLISGTRVSTILNSGSISFLDSLTAADTDGDGDYDTVFSTGSGRTGILLDAGGALFGSISNTGSITIEGNDSFGIRLRSSLDGGLSNTGSISVQGDRVIALSLEGDVSGDVISSGSLVATGLDATGISVTGDVSGLFRISGSVTTNGYRYAYRSSSATTLAALDADDLLQGGSALRVQGSLAHGLEIAGIGVEDDDDDDGDGLHEDVDGDGVVDDEDDSDDDQTATLATYGAAPTVLVSSTLAGGPVVLGAAQEGFGFVNRGGIYAYGIYDGVTATAIRIEGLAGAPVAIAGGVLNDRSVTATAYEADATALSIGEYVSAPAILNRGAIAAGVTGDTTGVAYGVVLSAGADTASLTNRGTISATGTGDVADAYAIVDRGGGLTSIQNMGSITAVVGDDDGGVSTGQAVAIDVSANTSGVALTQSAPSAFTDLDTTDDLGNVDTQITGDIYFGAGADTLGVYAGTVTGDVRFGVGADIFNLENAEYSGRLYDADGQLSINVANANLNLAAGTLALTSATFGSGAVLSVTLSETEGTYLDASGSIAFSDGASIVALVPATLPNSGAFVFLRAQNLSGASYVTGPADSGAAPYIYDLSIEVSPSDANALQASYIRKTAAQLGLNANESAVYEPLIAALRQDADAGAAMVSLLSRTSFETAYADLMPTFTTAASELNQAALDTQQKTIIDRAASRRDDRRENYWLQEIGYGVQRSSGVTPGYSGGGFGFAAGIDGPLMNGGLFGLSVAFTTSSSNEEDRASTNEISNSFGQVNAYWAFTTGPLAWTVLTGGGAGKASSVRGVSIGDDYEAELTADWSIAEGHATLVAEAPLKLFEGVELAPRLGLSYLGLWEGARSESGGVMGVEAEALWSQRLRGELGAQISFDGGMNGAPVRSHVYGGWRQDILDQDLERTLRFVGGGATFTMTDEDVGQGGVVAGAGVDFLGEWISFGLSVEGEFRDGYAREGVNATARIRF